MIVDFLLDVVFGIGGWIVGLLPLAESGDQFSTFEQTGWVSSESVSTVLRLLSFTDYILPLREGFVLFGLFTIGNGVAIALYRFVLRIKPW